MKLRAILNGRERELEVKRIEKHRYIVTVDGQAHDVDARCCAPDRVSLLLDSRSYDISHSRDGDSIELQFWNQHFEIEVLDERRFRMRQARAQLDLVGTETIKSSMPGRIVKMMVESGSTVEPGTGIVIVEAMKMESEIQCRRAGIVKAVHVEAGQLVESDALLAEIEPQ